MSAAPAAHAAHEPGSRPFGSASPGAAPGTPTGEPAADVTRILGQLQECPTAPYHEAYVAARIVALCRDLGLHVSADPYGNLVARTGPAPELLPAGARPIAFGAHMDHPALEVTEANPLRGVLLGGVQAMYFKRRVPVRFITPAGAVAGAIEASRQVDGVTHFDLSAAGEVPVGAFGVFDLGVLREEGDLLYGPAMDDLGGCAAILAALAGCARREVPGEVIGLFTRAEEVGLVGATLVSRQRLLSEETVVVSLETSRELPGAVMGGGPVIRVGDRSTAFHHDGEALLRRAAQRLTGERPDLVVQRQLMYGGSCEATAYLLAGHVATGVALPLGNYHNMGPDGVISAEYIHRHDLETCVLLLVAAAEEAARAAVPDPVLARLGARADESGDRLLRTAASWRLAR